MPFKELGRTLRVLPDIVQFGRNGKNHSCIVEAAPCGTAADLLEPARRSACAAPLFRPDESAMSQQIYPKASLGALTLAAAAMVVVVAISNYLVQFPLNDWLTWGAFSYPVTFLVTDLVNRRFGPGTARAVVAVGFLAAALISLELAPWRIAAASASAFLFGQLLDVQIFDRLRRANWWLPPLISSTLGSILDTVIFFSIAFAGSGLPWISWGAGDLAVKMGCALFFLAPFRALMSRRDALMAAR